MNRIIINALIHIINSLILTIPMLCGDWAIVLFYYYNNAGRQKIKRWPLKEFNYCLSKAIIIKSPDILS